jgi:hypothetical protein
MLHKFHACLRALGELGKIKRLFKQNEIIVELDRCGAELKAGLRIFGVGLDLGTTARFTPLSQMVVITSTLVEFSIDTERRHQELLELLASESGPVDIASSVGTIHEPRSCSLIWPGRLEGAH